MPLSSAHPGQGNHKGQPCTTPASGMCLLYERPGLPSQGDMKAITHARQSMSHCSHGSSASHIVAMGFCSAPFPCDSATAQQQAGRFAKPDMNNSCTHPGMSTSGRQGCLAYLLPWSYGRSHVQLPGGECCPSAAGPVLQQQCQYTGGTWPPVGPQKLYTPPHMLCGPWPSSAELL